MTRSRLTRTERLRVDLAIGVDFVPRASAGIVDTAESPAGNDADAARRCDVDPLDSGPAPPTSPAQDVSFVEGHTQPRATPAGSLVRAGERRADALERLRAEHADHCPHCTTATAHTNLVFGEGNAEARLVFVGEAPGETEDRMGRPFVGRAGQKLDDMIAAMGLRREDVYIANVLKSRPPNNRTPLPEEVAGCGPTLARQLAIIRPEVIVTLGAPATKFLLQSEVGITRLRGIWSSWRVPAELGGGEIAVMPTFHPAYLLRNYTAETRQAVWSDLQHVMKRLGLDSPVPSGGR